VLAVEIFKLAEEVEELVKGQRMVWLKEFLGTILFARGTSEGSRHGFWLGLEHSI